MPPRRSTPEGITIGFLGTGDMDVDGGMLLVQNYLDSNIKPTESVRWVFVLVEGEFTATLTEYVAIAKSSDIVYEVIQKSGDPSRRAYVEIANDAAKTYTVEDPFTQLEQVLKEATRSALFVLWDKKRDTSEQEEIFSAFIDAGLDVRELTEGLVPMSFEGEQGETPSEEEEPTEEMEIFARSDLEKMSMEDLKDIGGQLGVPPKKTRQAMVDLILEAQGGEEPTAAAEPAEPVQATATVTVAQEDVAVVANALVLALNEWTDNLSSKFNDFLARLDKVEIKVATPAPAPEPASTGRRLRRG